jgi:hypothetical protein
MAQRTVIINGVQYANCPEVNIPLVGGGTARFVETSDATLDSGDKLLAGSSAYADGTLYTGSMPNNGGTGGTISAKGGTVTIPAGFTTGGSVGLAPAAVADCVAGNILQGKSILGVQGGLSVPSVSQDSTTKVLTIQ